MANMDFMESPVVWVMIALVFAGIFATVGFMLMGEIDSNVDVADGTWNDSYYDVVGGVSTGFSMYGLIPLMVVVSVVIALLIGAFAFKKSGD